MYISAMVESILLNIEGSSALVLLIFPLFFTEIIGLVTLVASAFSVILVKDTTDFFGSFF